MCLKIGRHIKSPHLDLILILQSVLYRRQGAKLVDEWRACFKHCPSEGTIVQLEILSPIGRLFFPKMENMLCKLILSTSNLELIDKYLFLVGGQLDI